MWSSIARSVGFVVLFVLGIWLVGELLGFEIGLLSTLLASVALTVVANLVFAGARKAAS
ncbi:MAG: hypothetical protein ACQEVA_00680 [Myxococcota bacterium]